MEPCLYSHHGPKKFDRIKGWRYLTRFFYKKIYGCFAGWSKKVAVITKWLYYLGGCKAGFHCTHSQNNTKTRNKKLCWVLSFEFLQELLITVLHLINQTPWSQSGKSILGCTLVSEPTFHCLHNQAVEKMSLILRTPMKFQMRFCMKTWYLHRHQHDCYLQKLKGYCCCSYTINRPFCSNKKWMVLFHCCW